jgi:hypothetical protein
MRNPLHERPGMMGMVAFMLPMFLFRVDFPNSTPVERGVLAGHLFAAAMACGLVASYRRTLGLVVLPFVFLGLTTLTCWWIMSSR